MAMASADTARNGDARTRRGWTAWFALLGEHDPAARRHRLLLRFLALNLTAGALLGAAWLEGWVDTVRAGDGTGLVEVIALVFAAGLVLAARGIGQVSAALARLERPTCDPASDIGRYLRRTEGAGGEGRAILGSALKLRLSARIAPIRHVAGSLVLLGLIGTVVGFIIALSGVEPDAAADVEAIGPMVSTLIGGMSVALYTTLVGAVLNIWLMVNYRLLESGTVDLLAGTVERGEQHARA